MTTIRCVISQKSADLKVRTVLVSVEQYSFSGYFGYTRTLQHVILFSLFLLASLLDAPEVPICSHLAATSWRPHYYAYMR
jgi:hypothetical protein